MTGALYVDDRPRGKHGIGRFAREVLGRLDVPHRSLGASGNPARPQDLLEPHRLRLGRRDVLYSPGFNVGLTRARQIVTLHDLIHLETPTERTVAKTTYYERVVKPVVRRSGSVVTVSPTSADAIRTWLADDSVEIVDIGNGCADLFFAPAPTAPAPAGRLLYVGSMKPHKRVDVAFAALARLPEATLTLVTNEHAEVQRLATQHGIAADRIRVEADCPDERLLELYRASSCLVFPSELEGFGLPVVEAIAAGCPVVYRASCASVDAIARGIGVAVDSDEPADWAEACREPAPLTAPADWADRYSWHAVAGRLADTLTAVR